MPSTSPTSEFPIKFREYHNREELAQTLARQTSSRLQSQIATQGSASLCVGGGRFPQQFFQFLSQESLDWAKVTIVLGDERWVSPESESSNERLVRDHLYQNRAKAAQFIPLKADGPTPESAHEVVEHRLKALPSLLDITILGMGEDGHFASIIPAAPRVQVEQALKPSNDQQSTWIEPPGSLARITLTLPRLLASRWIVIAAPGETKRTTLKRAQEGHDIYEMPVRALIRGSNLLVEFWWAP